jgi:hypothetical protein
VDGALLTNGAVYLTNGTGVIVGPNGVVRADGGFVALALPLSDADFYGGGGGQLPGSRPA